ncbi:dihydrodipicolinate synthase family protein [Actinomadura madurae]|uniref:dihydrodipicolinate synthase family protein n=1 Tax=Actinomadura madurae TaxID=1993 RepID=UPI0020D20A70|nr:dihydrodipicolinate synthase family protein [Actinomadura madurae]
MSDTQTQSAPSPLGGVIVAAALPYREDAAAPAGLAVDHDRYAEHCRWLVANGCRGVGPNGSLGEYSALTDEERRRVARTAVEAVGGDGVVVAGVHGPGSHQARHWAEIAAEDGADGVLCLPPTMYRAAAARSSRTTRRWRPPACRSWSTTTRSTPRSTSPRTCSPRSPRSTAWSP